LVNDCLGDFKYFLWYIYITNKMSFKILNQNIRVDRGPFPMGAQYSVLGYGKDYSLHTSGLYNHTDGRYVFTKDHPFKLIGQGFHKEENKNVVLLWAHRGKYILWLNSDNEIMFTNIKVYPNELIQNQMPFPLQQTTHSQSSPHTHGVQHTPPQSQTSEKNYDYLPLRRRKSERSPSSRSKTPSRGNENLYDDERSGCEGGVCASLNKWVPEWFTSIGTGEGKKKKKRTKKKKKRSKKKPKQSKKKSKKKPSKKKQSKKKGGRRTKRTKRTKRIKRRRTKRKRTKRTKRRKR